MKNEEIKFGDLKVGEWFYTHDKTQQYIKTELLKGDLTGQAVLIWTSDPQYVNTVGYVCYLSDDYPCSR